MVSLNRDEAYDLAPKFHTETPWVQVADNSPTCNRKLGDDGIVGRREMRQLHNPNKSYKAGSLFSFVIRQVGVDTPLSLQLAIKDWPDAC